VADNANNIVWKWESSPFGETKPTGTLNFNLRFPGQYFDAETGTHYNINRDYNPVTGRYIQSDPIGFDGGVNSYLYTDGMPIIALDEDGLVYSYTRLRNSYQNKSNALGGKIISPSWALDAINASNGGSCAFRLSNAFNRAGYSSTLNYAWRNTTTRTAGDQFGKRYIYSAYEMGRYLGIDQPQYKIDDEFDIQNKQGIIYFFNYHIDLVYWDIGWFWDSAELVGNTGSSVSSLISKHTTYFMPLEN
jgi:RHS repeat-associated protein